MPATFKKPDGTTAATYNEVQSLKMDFLGDKKISRVCSVSDLVEEYNGRRGPPSDAVRDVACLPALRHLTVSFAKAKCGKDPSTDLVPNDLLQAAPLPLARSWHPVAVKGALQRQVPL